MAYTSGSHKSEDKVQFGICDYLKQGHRRTGFFFQTFFLNLTVFKQCYLSHYTFIILHIFLICKLLNYSYFFHTLDQTFPSLKCFYIFTSNVCNPYHILYTFCLCSFLLLQIWASYMLLILLSAWLLLCLCKSDMLKQRKIKLCV